MNKTLPVLAFTATLGFSGAAGAGLIDRGGGLIYDDVLKITWLQDANYGAGSSYDDGLETTDGLMTWQNALNWAANLSYSDSVRNQTLTGWRLPTVEPIGASFDRSFSNNAITDTGYAKTTTGGADGGWRDDAGNPVSEMGHMYYVNLANKGFCTPDDGNPVSCDVGQPQPGWGLLNTGPFINLKPYVYWSGTEYAPNTNNPWSFSPYTGDQFVYDLGGGQFYAWAVRSGDVAAVPEPASIALVGLGLAVMGWARRRRG